MLLNVYAYYDQKMKCFCSPMFSSDDKEVALENVARTIRGEQAKFSARDFSMYYLGKYDDVAGVIYGLDKPDLMAHLIEFVPQEAKKDE